MDESSGLEQASAAELRLGVSDFIALTNQTLEYAYPSVEVVGEVQGFKLNQGKFVFFDLKDEQSSIGCFMMAFQLRTPLEDGMQVVIKASPKLTQKGKFSLTVRFVQPIGEGSLRRSFELLKSKLQKEGLFEISRKRPLPYLPSRIGIVSSTQAAGYADFIKILDQRWGGLKLEVAHVQVQGEAAANQVIKALQYFNEMREPPEVVAILRGGGSQDDLMAFNDELLVRAVAASRVPVIAGIGHETDISLVDLASDVRAATPTDAASLLVPDKKDVVVQLNTQLQQLLLNTSRTCESALEARQRSTEVVERHLIQKVEALLSEHRSLSRHLAQLDPRTILKRGYSIVRQASGHLVDDSTRRGDTLDIETHKLRISAGVIDVSKK